MLLINNMPKWTHLNWLEAWSIFKQALLNQSPSFKTKPVAKSIQKRFSL